MKGKKIYIDFDNFDMESITDSITDSISEPLKKKYRKKFDFSQLNTLPKIEEFEKELDKELKQLKKLKKSLLELRDSMPKDHYFQLSKNSILLVKQK